MLSELIASCITPFSESVQVETAGLAGRANILFIL